MSRAVIAVISIIFSGLVIYLTSAQSPTPINFPYGKVFLLSFFTYFPLRVLWGFFLWPYYFSPLLKLPQAPYRPGLKPIFTERHPDEILNLVDTVPNEGIFRYLDALNTEIVHISSTKAIAEVFHQRVDDFEKPPAQRTFLRYLIGDGLITVEGAEHKLQRKYMAPAFNFRVVKNLYGLFWTKSCEMVGLIKSEIEAENSSTSSEGSRTAVVNIDEWAGRVSLDIIAQAGFGSDFQALSHPDSPLIKSYLGGYIPNSSTAILYLLTTLTHPTFVSILPLEGKRKLKEGIRAVTAFLREIIEKRSAEMRKEEEKGVEKVNEGRKDIISAAMRSDVFSVPSLVDQSKTLLAAGHDTSATALTWAIYLLSLPTHRAIQTRLRTEIRTHLPSPSSGIPITSEMLDSLPYLDAVSKEVMRFRTPVPHAKRVAVRDTEVCGHRIPKGTRVGIVYWAINQSRKLWGEDAGEFRPERWLEGKGMGVKEQLAFMTFGTGVRGCIGKGFAIGENKALLAALFGSFEFKPVGGEHGDLEIVWGVTARIVGGLNIEATIVDGW